MILDDLVRRFEQWFPPSLAESWDNVGLLLGDRSAAVSKVMTCLTVTSASAAEAIREGASLVVSHHPILFRPTKRLVAEGPDAVVYQLARAGVAVYSPHTAFDGAKDGINEQWAARLGLENVRPLRPASEAEHCKLVVMTPESDLEKVQAALFAAGAGRIGNYGECSFRVAGTGTFFGSDAANPAVGSKGRREEVSELRLEVVVPSRNIAEALASVRAAHSYEEPAIDVYPLRPAMSRMGGGRRGELRQVVSLEEFADSVRASVGAPYAEWVGEPKRPCRSVAIGCGAGAEFLDDAVRHGCDVLVTGEARFHDLLKAEAEGVGLILAGHYASERFAVETLAERVERACDIPCWASRDERDPRRLRVG
jgi:dinuclear metal center YbgI/SA1388 family protein